MDRRQRRCVSMLVALARTPVSQFLASEEEAREEQDDYDVELVGRHYVGFPVEQARAVHIPL